MTEMTLAREDEIATKILRAVRLIDSGAELEEVVRCKDCKHFAPLKENKYSRGDCMNYNGCCSSVSPEDYCSKGVRKECPN